MITRNTDYSIQRLRGLSTDTKPTDVPNGSEFREMDTGKKFLYSAAGTEWIEQQGSGGGSGESGIMIVHFRGNPNIGLTADKTFAEVSTAVKKGDCVFSVAPSGAVFPLSSTAGPSMVSIVFARVTGDADGNSLRKEMIIIDSNNVCSMEETVYPRGANQ